MNANSMIEAISKATAVLRVSPNLEDKAVFHAIVAKGVEGQLAARLVEFLPMVYCRLILENSGVRFAATFQRRWPDGNIQEHMFSSDSIWNAAMEFARAEIKRGVSGDALLAVAIRSAEFDAANQLLQKGLQLKDVAFTPPILIWPESGPVD